MKTTFKMGLDSKMKMITKNKVDPKNEDNLKEIKRVVKIEPELIQSYSSLFSDIRKLDVLNMFLRNHLAF